MFASYSLDIVNSEKWEDEDWMNYTRDRLFKMRAKRRSFDDLWDESETQVNSVSFYDNNWELQVNVPLEKTLGEIYMGRTNGKATFDIVPDGQANVEELQPAKFAMNFFLDGNGKDNFWKENKYMRENKWRYGSGIFFTWPRNYRDIRYKVKEWSSIEQDTDLLMEKNFEKIMNETWFFFPKAIHPKDFFIDDNAYGQPDVQYADDCIYKEKVTATEFNNRYAKSSAFINQEKVVYWQDINPKNRDDKAIDVRHVVLYHYFHRTTKKYVIFANESTIIYNGLYLYNDGKLPFVNVQHYSNSNRFWGEGIPERIGYLKIYKSEILQDILSGAAMSSGVHMLVGNDDQIGQDWQLGWRWLNLWRTTGGMDKAQQINTSPNLTYFSNVLELLDKYVVTDSGINPMAMDSTDAPTLWQQELIEANRSVRNSSVDENYNIGLDDALTMMLDRIKQFAPALLQETIKDKKGRVLKIIFPKIRIDNKVIEKKNWKQIFIEDIGKYGYFELKPGIVQGIGVKIATASTNSILPLLDRQKITEFLNNINSLIPIAQADQTGKMMQSIIDFVKPEELIWWMADAYGYDMNSLKATSQKDKIRETNLKKIDTIKEFIANNQPNATPWQPAPQATPSPSPMWGNPNPQPQTQQAGGVPLTGNPTAQWWTTPLKTWVWIG